MATCSFASLAHVTSLCGSSSRDPQDLQCITLKECNKDVSTHLKKLSVGPDTINDEKTLLLARAGAIIIHYCSGLSLLAFVFFKWTNHLYRLTNVPGIFTADQSCHLAMTICLHHREIYGLRWRSGQVRCCVPIEVAGHKEPKTKGDLGLNSRESSFILVALGELHSVGSCKSSK